MTRTVFDTAQVAHIWAQGRQEEGRNAARRVYFDGPRLFSYGSHFLTAYRLPDGAAFLNSGRYSVSTSRHQSQARHALRGRGYDVPSALMNDPRATRSAFPLPDFMEKEILARPIWHNAAGQEVPGPYDAAGERVGFLQYGATRPATPEEAKAARRGLLKLFLDCRETAPAESIVAAFRYAGAGPEEAAKAAAKVGAAHAKRAKEEAAQEARDKADGAARDARAAAARPLSDFAAKVDSARSDLKRAGAYRGQWEREAATLQEAARRLFRARKEAKARGWTRVAADCLAREKLLRQGAAGLESYALTLNRLAYWAERKEAIRAAGADLKAGAARSGYDWQKARQAAESLLESVQEAAAAREAGRLEGLPGYHGPRHWLDPRAALVGADLARMAAGLGAIVESLKGAETRAYAGAARAADLARVAALRAFRAAGPCPSSKVAEEAAKAAGAYASSAYYRPDVPRAFRVAGWTGEAFAALRDAANKAKAAALTQEAAAKVEAWREGGPLPGGRLSDPAGGALLRAVGVKRDDSGAIVAGRLGTSWGAEVPLRDAIRAFRFLKLCRDNGQAWRANGRALEVGHFRVDSVDTSGNFRAGCHVINWPEVAALASRLGLSDLAPADTTTDSGRH